ncbi:unnamed protein product [Durusdinium trenchii]|uniref:Tudor domain-containing protein n=1 Tax=Durusdinium trenchii TaxID=1381693 RepID=A0ABP0Q721_9DINO
MVVKNFANERSKLISDTLHDLFDGGTYCEVCHQGLWTSRSLQRSLRAPAGMMKIIYIVDFGTYYGCLLLVTHEVEVDYRAGWLLNQKHCASHKGEEEKQDESACEQEKPGCFG